MVFSSLLFLTLFLPITFFLYYFLLRKHKNTVLLVVSLIFYAWGEPAHIFLMLLTTLYTWGMSLLLERFQQEGKQRLADITLILCLVFGLGTLGYYKYWGFLTDILPFLKYIQSSTPALPIGISFYTFQAISYVIDVYRKDVKAQKNWANFAMYISFFPQLIAGPIVRYSDIEAQIERRSHSISNIYLGLRRFIFGLGKKVLLANQIGKVWDIFSSGSGLSMAGTWLGAIAFALQIYYDFSAYSDMAIGLGRMFGFHFTENFNYPYESTTITDFWRRWHISLGTWFREYVYIPLGGNRKGTRCQVRNLFIVWALTGLWHGAAWQFVFWGLYYFVFLAIEKFFLLKKMEKWPAVFRHLYSLVIIVLGWVLFASDSLSVAGTFYKAMFGIGVPLMNANAAFYISNYFVFLLILCVGVTKLPMQGANTLKKKLSSIHFERLSSVVCFIILGLCIAYLTADSYNPFLYFRF